MGSTLSTCTYKVVANEHDHGGPRPDDNPFQEEHGLESHVDGRDPSLREYVTSVRVCEVTSIMREVSQYKTMIAPQSAIAIPSNASIIGVLISQPLRTSEKPYRLTCFTSVLHVRCSHTCRRCPPQGIDQVR